MAAAQTSTHLDYGHNDYPSRHTRLRRQSVVISFVGRIKKAAFVGFFLLGTSSQAATVKILPKKLERQDHLPRRYIAATCKHDAQ